MKEKVVDKYITNALFELLKTKPMTEISTTELIAKAGVSRSSFYRNYYLIEDVLKQYGRDFFARIALLPPISMHEPLEHLQQVYEQYLTEKERLIILDRRELFHFIDDNLYQLCFSQTQSLGRFQGEYQIAIFAGAGAALIRTWIHNGFKETPREMAEITHHFFKWEH